MRSWRRSSPRWPPRPTTTSARAAPQEFRHQLSGQLRNETFGNGRWARNLFEAAIGRHAWPLREVDEPTLEHLRTLLPEDIAAEPAPPVDWEPVPDPGDPAVPETPAP